MKDMDSKYSEKQFELDNERSQIERAIDSVPPRQTFNREVQYQPVEHRPFIEEPEDYTYDGRRVSMDLHPTIYHEYRMPNPHARTFEESEFGFVNNKPFVGLNLAQRKVPNQAVKDPMADIKKREQDLQNERLARETELQADYQKRLAEFEKDF